MADREGHGQHRQAERQRDAEQADADLRKSGSKYGTAAATENQPERSKKLRRISFHLLILVVGPRY